MHINTLDKASIINELVYGTDINTAVHEGRRADFSLILSMFSDNMCENSPIERFDDSRETEERLRKRFDLPSPQPLRSDQKSYEIAVKQSEFFHQGGLPSAKLCHCIQPDALIYLPEDTCDLPEDVYHNLSGHQRRHLESKENQTSLPTDLYSQLVEARRTHQIHTQV
jgi:hypothetical protein